MSTRAQDTVAKRTLSEKAKDTAARISNSRYARVAIVGYVIVAVFVVACFVVAVVLPSMFPRPRASQLLTLGIAALIAAPLALASVWDRIAGVSVLNYFRIELKEVARDVDKDPVGVAIDAMHPGTDTQDLSYSEEIAKWIIRKIQESNPAANPLTVDLKGGERWRSTRLFFLAALVQQYTTVPYFVFAADFDSKNGCFIGMATPTSVRRKLAENGPYLEKEYSEAYSKAIDLNSSVDKDKVRDRLEAEVRRATDNFKIAFGGILEKDPNKKWVTPEWLRRVLGDELAYNRPGDLLTQYGGPDTQLLRWQILDRGSQANTRFVPVLQEGRPAEREVDHVVLVDRLLLATRIADASLRRQLEQ